MNLRRIAWALGVVVVISLCVIISVTNGTGFARKTLFQWLDAVIVPAVLATSIFCLNNRKGDGSRQFKSNVRETSGKKARCRHSLMEWGNFWYRSAWLM
jgi:hypothetical protein